MVAQVVLVLNLKTAKARLATIEDPPVIRRILAHWGLPTEGSAPCPSRPPPGGTADLCSDIPASPGLAGRSARSGFVHAPRHPRT